MRRQQFQVGEYYHIFNRGVESRQIFVDDYDYIRFLRGMREFNRLEAIGSIYEKDYQSKKVGQVQEAKPPIGGLASTPLVELMCYSLVLNHYHFILKPLEEKGIERFMHKLGTSFTMYFNQKYNRSGALFQGPYKSIHIRTDGNLFRLSAYINANIEVHKITRAEKWPWSSYQDYIGKRNGSLSNKKMILDHFKNVSEYKEFVVIVIKEFQDVKEEIIIFKNDNGK